MRKQGKLTVPKLIKQIMRPLESSTRVALVFIYLFVLYLMKLSTQQLHDLE
jgi:hypothetical protein